MPLPVGYVEVNGKAIKEARLTEERRLKRRDPKARLSRKALEDRARIERSGLTARMLTDVEQGRQAAMPESTLVWLSQIINENPKKLRRG